jgi:signal peptidase I
MKKIKNIILILSIFISANIYSQLSCGTPTNDIVQNFPNLETGFSINSTPICINVQFHIVRTTSGTGGATLTNIDQINNLLDLHFNPHNIFINKAGVDYINNSTFYDMNSTANDKSFNALITLNNNPNAINFYIINTNTTWVGKAQGIPSKNLVFTNSYSTTGVSAHEFGHCLNLIHTFRGSPNEPTGCAELTNGSNCLSCGDVICDTPADYFNVNSSGIRVPAPGYSPDITNDMSYYLPSTLNHFSALQGQRMRDALSNSLLLQPVLGNLCKSIVGSSAICSSPNQSYTISNSIGSNATWSVSSNLQIVSQNGQIVVIRPLSNSVNGSATITATFSNGQILTKNIWVGKPSFTFEYTYYEIQPAKSTLCVVSTDPNFTLAQQGVTNIAFTGSTIIYGNCIRTTSPLCKEATVTNACGSVTLKNDCEFLKQSITSYFTIYPNPSRDIVNIEIRDTSNLTGKGTNISGELFDMLGISKTKVEIINNKATFSVSGLNKGIYVLKIYINDRIENHQIAVE